MAVVAVMGLFFCVFLGLFFCVFEGIDKIKRVMYAKYAV